MFYNTRGTNFFINNQVGGTGEGAQFVRTCETRTSTQEREPGTGTANR